MTLIDSALQYREAGLSVIPVGADKRPTLPEWGPYQKRIADPSELRKWFKANGRKIGSR